MPSVGPVTGGRVGPSTGRSVGVDTGETELGISVGAETGESEVGGFVGPDTGGPDVDAASVGCVTGAELVVCMGCSSVVTSGIPTGEALVET